MSDYVRRAFRVQLASVMDTLLKAAVCEIAQIFEGSLSEQQTELTQRVEEISALRGRLEEAERSLRGDGGDPDTAAQLNADAETSSQTMSSVVTDDTEIDDVPDDWCAPIQWDEPLEQSSEDMEECPSVTLKPLSVSLWRIPNIKQEVEDDFESHLITALSTSPPHKRSVADDRLDRLKRRLERLNSSLTASGCSYEQGRGQEKRPVKVKKEALTTPITPVRRRVRKPQRKHDEELFSHSCRYCPRLFETEGGLKVHLWSHKKCSICHKTFPFPSLLLQHMKKSHSVKTEKDAAEEKQSNNHKVGVSKRHSCKYCSKRFLTKDLLKAHVGSKHSEPWEKEERDGDPTWTMSAGDPSEQQPSTTSSGSPRSQRAGNSSLTVSGQEKRPVRLKREGFKTPVPPVRKKKERLKRDQKSHKTSTRNASKSESKDGVTKVIENKRKTNAKGKSSSCRYCMRVFQSKASLKKHSWSHKRCSKCHKTFPFPSLLRQHMTACHRGKTEKDAAEKKRSNNMHVDNDPDEPREEEERNGDLDWTMPIKDRTDQQPSTSSSSPRSPATRNHRGKGKRLEVTGKAVPRGFTCKICQKVLSTKMTLIDHLRIHTGEKPVICRRCGESFRCHAVVSKHRKTCRGQTAGKTDARKKLPCKDCARRFSTQEKLTKHRQFVHKTKLNTCKICGQGFSYIGWLSLHYERVHT